MKKTTRQCLKCGRPIKSPAWLCRACRLENSQISAEAEGVSDLYGEEGSP